jgi:hypothetical protein
VAQASIDPTPPNLLIGLTLQWQSSLQAMAKFSSSKRRNKEPSKWRIGRSGRPGIDRVSGFAGLQQRGNASDDWAVGRQCAHAGTVFESEFGNYSGNLRKQYGDIA